ncbi:hypothetical protein Tco_1171745, partial [Tanacetum coccineum]
MPALVVKRKNTNGGHSKSAGKGPMFDVFSYEQGFFNVASSSTSTTPIVERIDKIERQIIDGKLILVDDDGKPLLRWTTKRDDDHDPYDDDLYESHGMSEDFQAICDDLDMTGP